jgi:DNA-binding NtrC family response regulator
MFEALPEGIVGVSQAAAGIRRFVERAAEVSEPVTLVGEAGTGKELAAKLIHRQSSRSPAPFLMIDCSLYYERELRRELFGCHSGDTPARKGLLEFAAEGTCYLSRIEELTPELQAEMVRFLRSGRFERLGDGKEIGSAARLIVSSEKNLHGFVKAGLFDSGLYSEVSGLSLRLAPVRERSEDVPVFVESLAAALWSDGVPRFARETLEALGTYPWPANFEDLRKEMHRLRSARLEVIRPENLAAEVSSYWLGSHGDPLVRKVIEEIDSYIREYQVLSRLDGGLADLFEESPAEEDELGSASPSCRPHGGEGCP